MNDFYLTDNVRICGDIMEYRPECGSHFRAVESHNWHKVLHDYGWRKLPRPISMKLNRLGEGRVSNSQNGVLDCEPDGNCFFQCIATALNDRDMYLSRFYDSSDIRIELSENITEEQYDIIIGYYRIMKDSDDFLEGWDPYSVNSLSEFKGKIAEPGHEYWGDYILLQYLIDILKVNIFILNCDSIAKNYEKYNTLNDYNSEYGSIFLLYEDNSHFKLMGHFKGKMRCYFVNDDITAEFKALHGLN